MYLNVLHCRLTVVIRNLDPLQMIYVHKLSDTQSILMYHSVVKVKNNLGPEFFKIKFQSLICKYCVLGKYKLCPCSTSLLLANNNICLYFQKSRDMLTWV